MKDDETINKTDPAEEPSHETEPKTETIHPKRRAKKLKIFLSLFFVVLLVLVLIAGWLGFVPGLSSLLGATKARDLGVHYTQTDFATYQLKTGTKFTDFNDAPDNPAKPGKKVVFADPKQADELAITQEEITAAVNSIDWAWMPLSNAQIKFTNDTVEVSGNIRLDHVQDFVRFIGGVGYSDSDVAKAVSWGKKFANNTAIYAKAKASVENDTLSLQLQQIQIGRFNVPMGIASKVVTTGTTNAIVRADNFEAKSVTFKNGTLQFSGTYPGTIYVKH